MDTRTKVPTHLTQLSSRHNSKALLCKSSPKHQHTSTDTNTSADTNTLTPIPTLTLIPTRSLDSAVSRPLGHSAQLSIFPDTLPRWWRMCVDTPVQFLAGCGRCGLCVCVHTCVIKYVDRRSALESLENLQKVTNLGNPIFIGELVELFNTCACAATPNDPPRTQAVCKAGGLSGWEK